MHEVDGVSRAAKGKGICHAGQCDFLIAAPVKSFHTGDSNRDLHMIEVTRGAQFPMVVVCTQFPESEIAGTTIHADLEVQFAGQTAHYNNVPFQKTFTGTRSKSRVLSQPPVPTSKSIAPPSSPFPSRTKSPCVST